MDSLVAINLTIDNEIINNNKVPFLYYWDGETDINEELKSNDDLIKFMQSKDMFTVKNYGMSYIAYFYFVNKDNKEECVNKCYMIQEWLPFYQTLINDYIKYHFNYLYFCSYKENFSFTDNFEADIEQIYDAIKTKYPAKVAKQTVINYVRAELMQTNYLVNSNIEKVINTLENILHNKE